jgi:hypothetical protein
MQGDPAVLSLSPTFGGLSPNSGWPVDPDDGGFDLVPILPPWSRTTGCPEFAFDFELGRSLRGGVDSRAAERGRWLSGRWGLGHRRSLWIWNVSRRLGAPILRSPKQLLGRCPLANFLDHDDPTPSVPGGSSRIGRRRNDVEADGRGLAKFPMGG